MDFHHFIELTLAFLFCAMTLVSLTVKLGFGSVIGYLLGGLIIGPSCLQVITDPTQIVHFSELGVIMLLFLIGLELEPKHLLKMKSEILRYGFPQVLLTGAVFTLFLLAMDTDLKASILISISLAFSSTALALQILQEKNALKTSVGKRTIPIILFHDMAVIVVLAILPLLALESQAPSSHKLPIWQGLLIFLATAILGHFLLNPLFRIVSRTKQREIFLAASLFIVIGMAYLMEMVGFSMALGAFMAGVLLADSEFRRQLEIDINPFKGLFLGLFFMSVGMSIQLDLFTKDPFSVLGYATFVVGVKIAVIYFLSRQMQLASSDRILISILLSQAGQFAFLILGRAKDLHIISSEETNFFFLVVTLSMIATPVLIVLFDKYIIAFINKNQSIDVDDHVKDIQEKGHHVVIIGYGRFGQISGRLLDSLNIATTIIDHDATHINGVKQFDHKVFYGDASHFDVITSAHISEACAVVLAIDDPEASFTCAQIIREQYPNVNIFARARNRLHYTKLAQLGIKNIKRETFDSSLNLAKDLLVSFGYEKSAAEELAGIFEKQDQKLLDDSIEFFEDRKKLIQFAKEAKETLIQEILEADEKLRGEE